MEDSGVGVAEASEAHERLLQDDGDIVVGAAEASEAHERLLQDDGDVVVGAAEASEAHEHIQVAKQVMDILKAARLLQVTKQLQERMDQARP